MKILGLDIGDAVTGVAIADASGIFISTRPDLKSEGLIKSIVELVKKEYATIVVYGLPLNSRGEEAFQCKKVQDTIQSLELELKKVGLTPEFIGIDERRSSIGAQLVRQNVGGKTRGSEHSIAAALLLEIYFQKFRPQSDDQDSD